MKNRNTARLVTVALMIAIEIVLTRFFSINTTFLRIGFGFLPISMLAVMYGPIWAGAAYAVGDVIGAFLFPSGPFFPGFTLTAFLTGLVFGIILYQKDVTWKRALLASSVVVILLNLVLDTYWLSILYGNAFIGLLPARIIKVAFAIPVETVLITTVWNKIFKGRAIALNA